jgi:hypothetical protein
MSSLMSSSYSRNFHHGGAECTETISCPTYPAEEYYGTKTAEATTVVQRPFLFPSMD